MIITKLSNVGVKKASVQSYHAAVLTLDGRAFIWGQNDYNQVTLDNNFDQSSPKLYACKNDERVKDVVCGEHFTVLLTTNSDEALYLGKGASKLAELKLRSSDNDSKRRAAFTNLIASKQYVLLNEGRRDDQLAMNFLKDEQRMLEEMIAVHMNVIKPLQKKNTTAANAGLLEALCRTYSDLLYFWAANVQSLIEYADGLISINDVVLFKYNDEHLTVYKSYINTIHNIISVNAFQNISKLVEISASLYKLRPDTFSKKDKNNEEAISFYLVSPLTRIAHYKEIIQHFCGENEPKKETFNKWNEFIEFYENSKKQAEVTRDFWLNGGRQVEFLKVSYSASNSEQFFTYLSHF